MSGEAAQAGLWLLECLVIRVRQSCMCQYVQCIGHGSRSAGRFSDLAVAYARGEITCCRRAWPGVQGLVAVKRCGVCANPGVTPLRFGDSTPTPLRTFDPPAKRAAPVHVHQCMTTRQRCPASIVGWRPKNSSTRQVSFSRHRPQHPRKRQCSRQGGHEERTGKVAMITIRGLRTLNLALHSFTSHTT